MGFKERIRVLEGCDENVVSLGLPKGDDHRGTSNVVRERPLPCRTNFTPGLVVYQAEVSCACRMLLLVRVAFNPWTS